MRLLSTLLIVVAAVLLLVPPESQSCGPFLPEAQFSFRLGPTEQLPYDRGRLGIVQPSYYRRNLIVAYRYFSGAPLTSEETATLAPTPAAPSKETPGLETGLSPATAAWLMARNEVPGMKPLTGLIAERKVPGEQWQTYQACLDDAFTTAAATLKERSVKWGAGSPELAEWVRGQDAVFQNCSEGVHLPAELKPGANALLAADRRYQIAAAEFYAEKFADAGRDFKAIGRDAASPWHERAPYLVARALIRQATLGGDAQAMQAAERQLGAILVDPASKALRAPAIALLGFVRGRIDPEGRMAELGAALAKPRHGARFDQDVTDFTMLWDKLQHGPASGRSELADWIAAYQEPDDASRAAARWRQTKNPAWLVAALRASGDAPADLIDAARALKPDHPAYATAVDLALGIETHRSADAAREWVDRALATRQPPDARNAFLARRQLVARDYDEFLRYAPREPVAVSVDQADAPIGDFKAGNAANNIGAGPQFAADSAEAFNRAVPLERWVEAAHSPRLPRNLQLEVAQAGWTRAILLGRQAEARALAGALAELKPALAPAMRAYLAETDPAAAKFAAVFLILRNPGVDTKAREGWPRLTEIGEIDEFRDNWWHWADDKQDEPTPVNPKRETPKDFLPQAEWALGAKEAKDLRAAAGFAPDYLCQQTLDWARQHPQDARVPEALHLAVRATRYGTTGPETTGFSKAAFQLLHTKYPTSKWATQTKYWY
jgi:hypothetical protein